MNIVYGIIAAPFIFLLFWWWTFGGTRSQPTYWRCTANHNHQTPEAARRCSAAQSEWDCSR